MIRQIFNSEHSPEHRKPRDGRRVKRIAKAMGVSALGREHKNAIIAEGHMINARALAAEVRRSGRKTVERTVETVVDKKELLTRRAIAVGTDTPNSSPDNTWAVRDLAQSVGGAFAKRYGLVQASPFELSADRKVFTERAHQKQDEIVRTQFGAELVAHKKAGGNLEWLAWGRVAMQAEVDNMASRNEIDRTEYESRSTHIASMWEMAQEGLTEPSNIWPQTYETIGYLAERAIALCEEIQMENPDLRADTPFMQEVNG